MRMVERDIFAGFNVSLELLSEVEKKEITGTYLPACSEGNKFGAVAKW